VEGDGKRELNSRQEKRRHIHWNCPAQEKVNYLKLAV